MSENSLQDTNDRIVVNECMRIHELLSDIPHDSCVVSCNKCEFTRTVDRTMSIRVPVVVAQHSTRTQHADYTIDVEPPLQEVECEITVDG